MAKTREAWKLPVETLEQREGRQERHFADAAYILESIMFRQRYSVTVLEAIAEKLSEAFEREGHTLEKVAESNSKRAAKTKANAKKRAETKAQESEAESEHAPH